MMLEMSDVRDDARYPGVRGFWGVGLNAKIACFYVERLEVGASVIFNRKVNGPGGVARPQAATLLFPDKALVIIRVDDLYLF
jgi:hypothetical protein